MRILVLLLPALMLWAVWFTIAYWNLKKRIRGLDAPELWLPRSERREHARKLLQREDQEYQEQMMERLTEFMKGGK